MSIKIGTYASHDTYAGWIEDEARTWIVFVKKDGSHVYFGDRDPQTGAVR